MSKLTERLMAASTNKSEAAASGDKGKAYDNTLSLSVGILDNDGNYIPGGFLKLECEANTTAEQHRENFLKAIESVEWRLTIHRSNAEWGTVFLDGIFLNEGTLFPAKENVMRKIKAQSIETLMAAKAAGQLIINTGNGYRYQITEEQMGKAV